MLSQAKAYRHHSQFLKETRCVKLCAPEESSESEYTRQITHTLISYED